MTDRYERLGAQADTGLGAEEFGTSRRFTRVTDRVELAQLDEAADTAWAAMQDARGTDEFDELRTAAFAAKDRADAYAHNSTEPPAHPTKNIAEGSHTNTQQRN